MFGKKEKIYDYDDIRPYKDEEIKIVIEKIMQNKQFMKDLVKYLKPVDHLPKIIQRPIQDFVVKKLKKNLSEVNSIYDFQSTAIIAFIEKFILEKTIKELTWSGLENLDPTKHYIFISNHRDIVLDPSLLNYILNESGRTTTQIAVGDNLLKSEIAADLIKCNKGFIVYRNLPMRKQVDAFIKLSSYINGVVSNGESIWIAQREGRAKDGNDKTNPAIVKMLYLAHRKSGVNFGNFIKDCNIVPVSFSYEYDPCDKLKAKELYYRSLVPKYIKDPKEDINSIIEGVKGYKGHVHVNFGKPLNKVLRKEADVADYIDNNIYKNYKLYPSNYISYDIVHNTEKFSSKYTKKEKQDFLDRYASLTYSVKQYVFDQYSNPVKNKYSI